MTTGRMVVLGAYKNRAGANHAVDELAAAGFEVNEISILFPDDRGAADGGKCGRPRTAGSPEQKPTELSFKETKDISSDGPRMWRRKTPKFRRGREPVPGSAQH